VNPFAALGQGMETVGVFLIDRLLASVCLIRGHKYEGDVPWRVCVRCLYEGDRP
jgi:hypothetical protein